MEEARKLMDSLMGQARNTDLKEAKKKKGQNFKDETCCKFHLLGFCPQYEDLFKNTKKGHLQIGDCERIHSDAMREEFEAHPEKSEYERTYSRELLRYLESLTRKVDDTVRRQRQSLELMNRDLEEKGLAANDTAKRQIDLLRQDCAAMLRKAEELAEAGDIEGSKAKTTEHETMCKTIEEYEERAKAPMKEDICDICGLRTEDVEGVRVFTHTEGRVHIGFVKIREWVKKLKARLDELEAERGKKREEGRSKDEGGGRANDRDDGDRQGDRGKERDTRREVGEVGREERDYRGGRDDRRRDDRDYRRDDRARGDDRGYRRDDRGYDRRGGDERDYRGGGGRGYDRGGDGGRRGDRGYDDGYARGRSRSRERYR